MAPLATGAFLFGPALNEPFHSPVMSNWYTVSTRRRSRCATKLNAFIGRMAVNFAKLPIAEEGKDI